MQKHLKVSNAVKQILQYTQRLIRSYMCFLFPFFVPKEGKSAGGGIFRRIIVEVPAIGPGSPRQNIPRGSTTAGASKDRQFTDQNCGAEVVGGVSHSIVRMRHRSCHFCKPCMRLDPSGKSSGGTQKCLYEELCGPADNVVRVPRQKVKNTVATRSSAASDRRVELGRSAALGEVVACFAESEPGAWFLGRVRKTCFKPNCSFAGSRGEAVKEGVEYLVVQRLEEAVWKVPHSYQWSTGNDGKLHVLASGVVKGNVALIDPKTMTRRGAQASLGEEWDGMSRREGNDLLSSPYMYLPVAEREKIWAVCPQ